MQYYTKQNVFLILSETHGNIYYVPECSFQCPKIGTKSKSVRGGQESTTMSSSPGHSYMHKV